MVPDFRELAISWERQIFMQMTVMQLYVAGYCLRSIKGSNFFFKGRKGRRGVVHASFPEVGFVHYLGFDQLDVVVVVGGGLVERPICRDI